MTDLPIATPSAGAASGGAGEGALASGLLGPVQVRSLAAQLGVSPTKKFGQNFVHDPGTVRKIVRAAGVPAGANVVEVGPGLGSLTLALLEAGARVSAVEIDPVLAAALPQTVATYMPAAQTRLAVRKIDALQVRGPADLAPIAKENGQPELFIPTYLVANLPYNVAVPVILNFLAAFPALQCVLVMVQLEVANRLAAQPGSRTYGVPSVKANWYAQVERAALISRQVFWPVPNVDSALVRLQRRRTPMGPESLRDEVFSVVEAAFAQRRKTLRAALSQWAGSATKAQEYLQAAGIDPQARGEMLTVADFVKLVEVRHALNE